MTSVAPSYEQATRKGKRKEHRKKKKKKKKKRRRRRRNDPRRRKEEEEEEESACLRDVAFAGHHAYVTLREGPLYAFTMRSAGSFHLFSSFVFVDVSSVDGRELCSAVAT